MATSAARAQTVLWAAKVVEVSSQKAKGKEPYSPEKVLGAPNALPLGEVNNEAWIPAKEGTNEFIEVRFLHSIKAQQITVIENFNPGSVTKIELIDTKGEKHEVYKNETPGPIPVAFRTLQVKFKPDAYLTIGARVTMNTGKVQGVNQIDAIGVANVDVQIVKQDFKNAASEVETVQLDSALKNLGPNVNSKWVDTHPVISPDGRTLFFARQGHPGNRGGARDPQDIWYSRLESAQRKTWGIAKNLGTPPNGPEDPNGLASVSANRQAALLIGVYVDGFMMPKGFSTSRRSPGGWSIPT
ncbi:MAG: hypothetical protein EOO57_22735, partial [Hymenobacter sp.]